MTIDIKPSTQAPSTPDITDDDWIVMQEILHAISQVPNVWERIEAYLIARDIDNPREAIKRWYKIADA